MAGLYIHIPFCKSRCIYCGFYSTTGLEHLSSRYVSALEAELEARRGYLRGEALRTVYIGGGTPSVLSCDELRRIGSAIACYGRGEVEEFTMECNPNDISDALCETMSGIGVNRVSIGVQTFSDARLRFLRRRHTAGEIRPAIERLRSHGFGNISIDLMFGFPGETLADWEEDLMQAVSLGAEHISAYSLMYEEGTPLYRMLEAGMIKESAEETSVKMYDALIDRLAQHGYEQYEISNFCRPGWHSRHNASYWDGTPYLGIGAAAHSYDGMSRQWNASDLGKYIEGIESGTPQCEREELDADTRYNDMIATALRTRRGIPLATLSARHRDYLLRYAREGLSAGLLAISDGHLRLTRKGLYVSDSVMAELIYA